MDTLLVIDDDPLTLDCFRYLFPQKDVTVLTATSATAGLELFAAERPDVIILDIHLPDLSGLEAFRRIHDIDKKVPVILITGRGKAETAIEAMRRGAYEYVVKPLDPDGLRKIISRAFEVSRHMRVKARVADQGSADDASDILVGNCAAMQEVYKAIGRVAPQDVTVLILGESGTGKELVARAIYHYSNRAAGPLIPINCAAIPENLLESELFGHEKGAFTGADRKRIGKFEQCNRGTLFLDEIGDMTLLTQTKILRVLQDGQFERIGGNESVKTDTRIIAATNRDLETMIGNGQFRSDLFYRLKVYSIHLPPLRERGDDLPLLVDHFLRRFGRELGKETTSISPDALACLVRYSWPGNVRELQSVLKQAILHAAGPILVPEFFPTSIRGDANSPVATSEDLARLNNLHHFVEQRLKADSTNLYAEFQAVTERQLFLHVLRHAQNNLTLSARILGISRNTLRSRLAALGIAIERTTTLEEEESRESKPFTGA